MTPHKHWLRNYTPLRIPACLANDQIVYSEGVGSVVFAPEAAGINSRSWGSTRGSLNTAGCGEQLYSEGIHDKTDLQDVVSN